MSIFENDPRNSFYDDEEMEDFIPEVIESRTIEKQNIQDLIDNIGIEEVSKLLLNRNYSIALNLVSLSDGELEGEQELWEDELNSLEDEDIFNFIKNNKNDKVEICFYALLGEVADRTLAIDLSNCLTDVLSYDEIEEVTELNLGVSDDEDEFVREKVAAIVEYLRDNM